MLRTRPGNKPIETEGHRRKRRWAILLLVLCSALLVVGYVFHYFLEPYQRVLAVSMGVAGSEKRLAVLVQTRQTPDEDQTYERWEKTAWGDWKTPARLFGTFLTAAGVGDDLLVFHEESASRVSPGKPSEVLPLDGKFLPRAAVAAPGGGRDAWVFGLRGTRRISAARYSDGEWVALPGPDLPTDSSASGVKAAAAPWGAWVAWMEPQGSPPSIRVARREATSWQPYDARVDFFHGESLFTLCSVGDDAWLLYADRKLEAKGELAFLARRLTRAGVQEEIPIPISDPLRVKRAVLSISAARFEGAVNLFLGRMGGVQTARIKEDIERRMYLSLQDPGGRLSHQRRIAWAWIGSLVIVASLLTGTGVALLRERRFEGEAEEESPPVPLPSATLAQRGIAYVIDFFLLIPFGFLFEAFLFNEPRIDADATRLDYYLRPSLLLSLALFHVAVVIYYTLCEANFGQTVGKWVVGITVLDASGKQITLRQAIVRNLVRVVDAGYVLLFFVGLFSILVTQRGQRVGDLLAGTVVVRRPQEERDEDEEEESEEEDVE